MMDVHPTGDDEFSDGVLTMREAGLDRLGWRLGVVKRFGIDEWITVSSVGSHLAAIFSVDGHADSVHWRNLARRVFATAAPEQEQIEAVQEALELLEAEGYIRPVGLSGWEATVPVTVEVQA
jgi:hypothetical protein